MDCKSCGCTNRPYLAACESCGQPLQPEGDAARRRDEWEALQGQTRSDFESRFDRMLTRWRDYKRRLNKHRKLYITFAALVYVMTCFCTYGALTSSKVAGVLFVALDVAVASFAALGLHMVRGGPFTGMLFFFVANVVSVAVRLFARGLELDAFTVISFLSPFAILWGFLVGLQLDQSGVE